MTVLVQGQQLVRELELPDLGVCVLRSSTVCSPLDTHPSVEIPFTSEQGRDYLGNMNVLF